MTEEQVNQIKEALANGFLNSFNLTIIVEACKLHAIKLANDKFASMSDEDKESALKKLEEAISKEANKNNSKEDQVVQSA